MNPTEDQKAVYHVLCDVYSACKKALRPGNKVSSVYAAAVKAIQDAKRPDLLPKFTKSCGFGMGLEFREQLLLLNDKNQRIIAKGQQTDNSGTTQHSSLSFPLPREYHASSAST